MFYQKLVNISPEHIFPHSLKKVIDSASIYESALKPSEILLNVGPGKIESSMLFLFRSFLNFAFS